MSDFGESTIIEVLPAYLNYQASVQSLSEMIKVAERQIIHATGLPTDLILSDAHSGVLSQPTNPDDWLHFIDEARKASGLIYFERFNTAALKLISSSKAKAHKLSYLRSEARRRGFVSPRLAKRIRKWENS